MSTAAALAPQAAFGSASPQRSLRAQGAASNETLPNPRLARYLNQLGIVPAAGPAAPVATAPTDFPTLLRTWFSQDEPELFARVERETIMTAFDHCDRNQVQTAKLLGISRNVLRAYLKRYGVIR